MEPTFRSPFSYGISNSGKRLPRNGLLLYLARPNSDEYLIGEDTEVGEGTYIWGYVLPDDSDIRAATGWVNGTANVFYDADGTPVVALATEIATASVPANVVFCLTEATAQTGRLAIYAVDTTAGTIAKARDVLSKTLIFPEDGLLLRTGTTIETIGGTTVLRSAVPANANPTVQQVKGSGFAGAGSATVTGLLTTDTITATGDAPTCSVGGTLTFPGADCWDVYVHRAGVLWAYWPGISVGQTTELDASGNGHHLTTLTTTAITERVDGSGTNAINLLGFSSYENKFVKTTDIVSDNAKWLVGAVTKNFASDPFGGMTAVKLTESATTSLHYLRQEGNIGAEFKISIYAKAGERSVLQLSSFLSTTKYVNFNLSTGQISAVGSTTSENRGIEAVGDGWYRCWAVLPPSAAGIIGIVMQSSPTALWCASYAGDGTSGLYLAAPQLESSTLTGRPKPYAATLSAQICPPQINASIQGLSQADYIPPPVIVVGGDSRSNKSSPTDIFWPTYVDDLWSEVSDITIYNTAVGGRTLGAILDAYPTEVAPHKPNGDYRYFVIIAAANDLGVGMGATGANTYEVAKQLWALAKADGFTVIASTEAGARTWPQTNKDQCAIYNTLVRSDPTLFDALIEPDVEMPNSDISSPYYIDGVHLTDVAGSSKMAELVVSAIRSLHPVLQTDIVSHGPLRTDITIAAGTAYPNLTVTAPLGPELQGITEWTGGAEVDLSALVATANTRIGGLGVGVWSTALDIYETATADEILKHY